MFVLSDVKSVKVDEAACHGLQITSDISVVIIVVIFIIIIVFIIILGFQKVEQSMNKYNAQ